MPNRIGRDVNVLTRAVTNLPAMSSGEAELHGVVKAGANGLGILSMLKLGHLLTVKGNISLPGMLVLIYDILMSVTRIFNLV